MIRVPITLIRGTTPTHTFELPFETNLVKEVRVSYSQEDSEVLTKTETSCALEGNTVSVKLTQEETLAFKSRRSLDVQLKVFTTSNDVLATDLYRFKAVVDCLCEEVLV
jgi:hypothetical protein